jgi:hypothetical protein
MKKLLCGLGLGFLLLSAPSAFALNPPPRPAAKPIPARQLTKMVDEKLSDQFAEARVKLDRAKPRAETVAFHGDRIGKEAKIVTPIHGVVNRFTGEIQFNVAE